MTQSFTLLDGGIGRLLEQMGAPFCQPEWSARALIEAPGTVSAAHNAFIQAGAEVITTNAYALVPFHIGEERFTNQGRPLIQLAARIARQSASESNQNITVAGCIPPVFGSYRPDLFQADKAGNLYAPLIEEQAPYIDVWLAETISSIEEATAVAQAVQKTRKPLWLSYSLQDRENEKLPPQLRSGEDVASAAKHAIDLGVDAILFNCSQIEEMAPALSILQDMSLDIPYGAYANAFPAIKKNNDSVANTLVSPLRKEITPSEYQNIATQWLNLGASIIGGCCGIMPEHIEYLSALKRRPVDNL